MAKKTEETEIEDTPEYLTQEGAVELVNKAISTHLNRFSKNFESKITDLLAANKPEPPPEGEKAEEGGVSEDIKAQMKAMSAQIEQARKVAEAERARREAAESAAREQEEHRALETALKANGVADSLLAAASAQLVHSEKRLNRSEDGSITFKYVGDFGEENLPISEGVAKWANSPAGKAFKAPSGAQGGSVTSGNAPQRRPTPGKEASPMQLFSALASHMDNMLANPSGTALPDSVDALPDNPNTKE